MTGEPDGTTAPELYATMVGYLVASGWRREEAGSGWWWKHDAPDGEAVIGGAVEQQLELDGIDLRTMLADEPGEYWATLDTLNASLASADEYTRALVGRIGTLEASVRRWRDRACRQKRRAELWRARTLRYRGRR